MTTEPYDHYKHWEELFRSGPPELLADWEEAKRRDRIEPDTMARVRFLDFYRSGEWARAYHAMRAARGDGRTLRAPPERPERTETREGALLRAHRILAEVTLRELEGRTGIPRSALSRIERGRSVLSLAAAVKIADALDISLDALRPGNQP